jgi:hypothetical protein
VCVTYHVESRLLAQVGGFFGLHQSCGLRLDRPRQSQEDQRERYQNRAEFLHCNSSKMRDLKNYRNSGHCISTAAFQKSSAFPNVRIFTDYHKNPTYIMLAELARHTLSSQ